MAVRHFLVLFRAAWFRSRCSLTQVETASVCISLRCDYPVALRLRQSEIVALTLRLTRKQGGKLSFTTLFLWL